MLGKKRPFNLVEDRAVMQTSRDLAIGAYARRQRRWRILLGLAGVALIGGAGLVYYALLERDPVAKNRNSIQIAWECAQCGERGISGMSDEKSFPLTCPKCQVRSAHKLWTCLNCAHKFLNRSEGPEVTCPKCHSRRVGSAVVTSAPAAPLSHTP